jgi:hypothetical protein
MDPVVRVGTKYEDNDRRLVVMCVLGAAPVAAIIGTLIYWLV